ncbi:hypothetical protein BLNAU_9633 [Blattamonas nauphoetae]|uniref:Uncharacterized protein n=1 Tax=Blattamonas nauphoetae TaxID=2049346 RepID=A0ABQ9XVA0_9EUKA|nr:hypothetical protein BLNAU_9633 [Blattamonas nauphoetae]
MLFSHSSHFSIDRTTLIRTRDGGDPYGYSHWSSALISDPFTSGVVSITITVFKISTDSSGVCFGVLDSSAEIPWKKMTIATSLQGLHHPIYVDLATLN